MMKTAGVVLALVFVLGTVLAGDDIVPENLAKNAAVSTVATDSGDIANYAFDFAVLTDCAAPIAEAKHLTAAACTRSKKNPGS